MTPEQFRAKHPRSYSDWFGIGDNLSDFNGIVASHGEPESVFESDEDYMIAVVYLDKIIVSGYDGNEYCHSFTFTKEQS